MHRNGLFSGEAEGAGTSLALVPGPRPAADGPSQREALLLRPVEAARLLGIGRSKLFEMLAQQELPVIRIGRCVRIPRRELREWVDSNLELELQRGRAWMGHQPPVGVASHKSRGSAKSLVHQREDQHEHSHS